ncbi:MAG: ABC transporter permease [Mucilaginibacter sp.]|uniref:ABC transporter permease n=1 Tax=Mucilaginibacter sp. TaxID=1882438 RepID=UPI0031A37D46
MIKNYFKIAWRSLWKNKAFSTINIVGLAVGMCGAILIFTWIQNELSFDLFHANKDNLYKVWNVSEKQADGKVYTWDVSSSPVAPYLQQNFPEVKATARVYWPNERLFNFKEKSIVAKGLDVDKQFLTMFSFPMINGSNAHALDDIKGIVLTETLAKKIFGNEEAINKIVKINNKDSYTVTGVVADPPSNTRFQFDYLISLAPNIGLFAPDQWRNASYNTYIQLKPGTSAEIMNAKMKGIMVKHDPNLHFDLFLHPVSKWHLYSRFENGVAVGGAIETVRFMVIIALLILLTACINFMNLSTAQSEKRGREVGVRKVIGASRFAIIKQFLTESVLIAIISGILAMILAQLLLPTFNQLSGTTLSINYLNIYFWLSSCSFVLLTGLLAGSYPAFYLSAFRPVKTLKGLFKGKSQVLSPRKLLVVTQFTIAIVLTVATLVIYNQIQYVQNRNAGYVRANLIEHPMNGAVNQNFDLIKNELLSTGAAVSVSKTGMPVTLDASASSGFNWGNMSPDQHNTTFSCFKTSGDFVKTFGFKLTGGRDIDMTGYPTDSASIVINEAAVKVFGFKDAVGQTVKNGNQLFTVVGVIKDFIIGSPYQPVNPMIIFGANMEKYGTLTFRINDHQSMSKSLKIAEGIFKKYNPAYPFMYKFVDEEYGEKFKSEQRTGQIAFTFATLTIFISCLGLFGLAAYMAENRSKEIGIRKVLGASVLSVMQLLTREFIILVIVALIIATPVGWWLMNKWLQDYSYRIHISWVSFAASGLMAIIIAVVTVSFQAGKVAMTNPVKSIKSE